MEVNEPYVPALNTITRRNQAMCAADSDEIREVELHVSSGTLNFTFLSLYSILF